MSKKLNKILLMILVATLALCCSFITIGMGRMSVADSAGDRLVMHDGAQVRQEGEMGIRFGAMISAADYASLNDAEFGMLLAPTEWVKDISDLSFDSTTLKLHGTHAQGEKYFATGKNIPVQDTADFDGDDDTNEYVLTCSFIKIKETNFDRSFTARAYYKIGNTYYYSNNVANRCIYTVASKHLASNAVETEEAETYITKVVDTVVGSGKYALDVTVNGLPEDSVEVYKNDKITASASLVSVADENVKIESGIEIALTKDGSEVEEGVIYNALDNEYTLNTSGHLQLTAKIGSKEEGSVVVTDLTVKRKDVSVKIIPGTITADGSWSTFAPLANTERVIVNDFVYNKVDAVGNSVKLKTEVVDNEIDTAPSFNINDYTLSGDPAWFQLGSYSGTVYLANRDITKKINPISTVSVTYTDHYGIDYTAELPVYGSDELDPVYFGKDQDSWTATDSLILELKNYQWLTIEDVPLTALSSESLMEYTVIHDNLANKGKLENKMWQMIISEADNPSNYIKYSVGYYDTGTGYVATAMNTPNWSTSVLGYALRGTAFKTLKNEPGNDNPGWYNTDSWFARNAFTGKHQWNHDADNYRGEMFAFSIYNSEIFLSGGWINGSSWKWTNVSSSLLPKSAQTANGLTEWKGFDGFNAQGKKVDISILPSNFKNGCTSAMMVIDKLGGQKVTADWLDNVYYSYSSTGMPNLFTDVVA